MPTHQYGEPHWNRYDEKEKDDKAS